MTPQGRRSRSRRPSAAGRMTSPEAVTETKAGYKTADTCWSKSFHLRLGQRSPPFLQLDSLWPSRSSSCQKKSVVHHLRCVGEGSGSSASSCAGAGRAQQLDWQQDWTSHRLGRVDSLAERLAGPEADDDDDMDGNSAGSRVSS